MRTVVIADEAAGAGFRQQVDAGGLPEVVEIVVIAADSDRGANALDRDLVGFVSDLDRAAQPAYRPVAGSPGRLPRALPGQFRLDRARPPGATGVPILEKRGDRRVVRQIDDRAGVEQEGCWSLGHRSARSS
ncbi:hypothetical protein [Acrocarpospora sp. B8E8]|uniref:hypothetical protein n=1 Tax=Acrocarpospora sp. B8E8 TaxID=3153572 RepID=UPI00325F4351